LRATSIHHDNLCVDHSGRGTQPNVCSCCCQGVLARLHAQSVLAESGMYLGSLTMHTTAHSTPSHRHPPGQQVEQVPAGVLQTASLVVAAHHG
jgi:hypothetical protein